jgi:hypothetical protein
VQVVEEVSREGDVTSSNPTDRVVANFARKMPRLAECWAPLPIKKNLGFFYIFSFRALPSVGHSIKAFRVPDKRHSAKAALPTSF